MPSSLQPINDQKCPSHGFNMHMFKAQAKSSRRQGSSRTCITARSLQHPTVLHACPLQLRLYKLSHCMYLSSSCLQLLDDCRVILPDVQTLILHITASGSQRYTKR